MTEQQYEKTMLQQISDVAWLVHRGKHRLGILNKDVQEHYTYITGKELVNFDDENQVIQHFGNLSLFEEKIDQPAQKQDTYYIKGYAVDYVEPHALDPDHPDYRDDLPLYTKIEGRSVYYAAGYYCICFEKGWKHAQGPKLATLEKYGYEGPFRTELEARERIKVLNRQRRNEHS